VLFGAILEFYAEFFLGIFKRLSMRDDKHQYLNNIPLVKKYVLQIADKYPEFAILKVFL
jgi:aminoglycoside/choline kinase family phosphotransferase